MNEQEAKAFDDGPLDRLKLLAQTGVPIFALVNGADKVVPPAENTFDSRKRPQARLLTLVVF